MMTQQGRKLGISRSIGIGSGNHEKTSRSGNKQEYIKLKKGIA
jgi:hypothetical protein